MIPLDQIQYVKQEADLKKVVESLGVELRRAGANWVGKCPFHNEKTGSFTVHPRNNHWKCYGCNEGGNAIDFVMKKKGCDFVEAVKYVADIIGYTLTDDYHETTEQRQVRERKMEQVDVNKLAVVWFQNRLMENKQALAYINERGWSDETLQQWEIGYAPNDWNALWDYLRKEKKVPYDVLTRSTLFKKNKNGTGYYCRFRDRIMFPILSTGGEPIAFSGRIVPWYQAEPSEKVAKYINSTGDEDDRNTIYVKGETLFGWNFARAEASKLGEVVLVEGNPDVIKMHQLGIRNVVAACGTALTKKHAAILAKTVSRAVLLYDSDPAGQNATEKNGKVLLESGVMTYTLTIPDDTYKVKDLREDKGKEKWEGVIVDEAKDDWVVYVVKGEEKPLVAGYSDGERFYNIKGEEVEKLVWPKATPEPYYNGKKQDPDTFFKNADHFRDFTKKRKSWFVYVAEKRKVAMGDDPDPAEVATVAAELAKLLLTRDEGEHMGYVDQLAKIIPPKKVWNAAIKQAKQKTTKELNSAGFDKEQEKMIDEYGFFVRNHCYHVIANQDGGYRQVSNFELEPLFHIESTINAKRLYRLTNNRGIRRELEIAQKDMVSLTAFKTKVESFGNFLFTGTDGDLNKIKAYLYEHTKTCREVEQLGWQREGFWAWSNGVLDDNGEMRSIDELGSVEAKGQWYYLPALSSFFKADTQLFQFERRFIHTPSGTDLNTLAEKMLVVYSDNAIVGIGYTLATLFRDYIFRRFNSFPMLNIFGQKGTGKTEMAITLLHLFGNHADGLNMTNATLPALADHVSHCRNALVHIDEYKNSVEYDKIEFLKGLYDGTGRSRMNMDRDKKKEMTPVDCGIILTGQERTTADNALFSRVIYITVSQTVFSAEQNAAYEDLKRYEKQGLTCITNELLAQREWVLENYEKQLAITKEEMRQATDTRHIEGRILQNWTMVLAMLRTLEGRIALPFSYDQDLKVFVEGMERQNGEVKSSNEIANFWVAVETMLTNGDIETGYDLKLYFGKSDVRCHKGSGESRQEMNYSQTYDVIYLSTSRVFKLYAKLMKGTKDSKSSIIDEGSLRHYLTAQDEYMGECVKMFKVPTRLRQNPSEGKSFTVSGQALTVLQKANRSLVFNYAKLVENYGIDLNVESKIDEDNPANDVEVPY